MLKQLANHLNETATTNGAVAYRSTQSAVLDLFSQGGAMRERSDADIVSLFSKAFAEDPALAMKTLFYLRDIRQGQGERKFFRLALKHLAKHHPASLEKNLHLIPEFGRWDDLWVLLDTGVKKSVIQLVSYQLKLDKHNDTPSLLGKWMPSANTSSHVTKGYARILIQAFGTSPKKYRQLLTELRKRIAIVETKMTEGRYEDIAYDKLPSKAGMQYRGAFFRNDEERYRAFLNSLSAGEVKVNSGTLYPNDIVGKILDSSDYYSRPVMSPEDIQLFEGQWQNLPNFIGDNKEESIVMADVSGSMYGTPLNVSIALAMYIAERNEGGFHNHFMTFSNKPQLVKIEGADIVEKVANIEKAEWGMNTNIEKALKTLLVVALENGISKEDMVKKIYIISDMQFDQAIRGGNIFGNMANEYAEAGYALPNVVFWNVNAYGNSPMTMNEHGVQLVSGFSPSILAQLLNSDGKTPYEFMLDVIDSPRYQEVTA